jgi:putative PIN family toxin of toxin-antitoxin system
VRAVFDSNVLVSALISPRGTPAALAARWREGHFELVVSERLLAELEVTLGYPKLRKLVSPDEAAALIALLRENATVEVDPPAPPRRSRDTGDDYLIALAEAAAAVLVSGDRDLLDLGDEYPIVSPGQFLARLG